MLVARLVRLHAQGQQHQDVAGMVRESMGAAPWRALKHQCVKHAGFCMDSERLDKKDNELILTF